VGDLTDFDGCRRSCRKNGHTLVWGECEHAPEPPAPEPTVYVTRKQIEADGWPSISFVPVAVKDLDEVRALRAEVTRLEVKMITGVWGDEFKALARERHDARAEVRVLRAELDRVRQDITTLCDKAQADAKAYTEQTGISVSDAVDPDLIRAALQAGEPDAR